MSPFICYHASPRSNRESIARYGLVARPPFSGFTSQPFGVYAFSPDLANDLSLEAWGVRWDSGSQQDLWQIAYVGPMQPDPLVENAVVLPSVTSVTLVTGNG